MYAREKNKIFSPLKPSLHWFFDFRLDKANKPWDHFGSSPGRVALSPRPSPMAQRSGGLTPNRSSRRGLGRERSLVVVKGSGDGEPA